jgi:hypothetical protein
MVRQSIALPSHRSLRDKATKALVSLFSDRAALALMLWNAFFGLDDLYVVERLTATIYGAAMQGRWSNEELKGVAETLHSALFADGTPPANLLLRDHARGMVGYAAARGALSSEFDPASIQPPFSSPWPIEQISQEQMATFTCAYGEDGERFDDEIANSLNDGDFARYVLDTVVRRFTPAPYETDPLPATGDLKAQWLAEFTVDATESDITAYLSLEAEMATIRKDKQDYAVASQCPSRGQADFSRCRRIEKVRGLAGSRRKLAGRGYVSGFWVEGCCRI